MEHVGFVSTDLKKKYKNTQNTWPVHLFFWCWRKTQKHAKYKEGCPCAVWASPHVYNKTQKIQKNKPNKTSLQYCLLAHLHQGVKKYKNTQWLTIFFLRIHGKKIQNYIKHKRHIWSFSDLQRAISTTGACLAHHMGHVLGIIWGMSGHRLGRVWGMSVA